MKQPSTKSEQQTSRLHRMALFPFLFPLFFVLHVQRYYHGLLPFGDLVQALVQYLTVALLFGGLLRIFFKNTLAWSLGCLLLTALWVYWGDIVLTLPALLHLTGNYAYDLSIAIGGICIVLWISYRLRKLSSTSSQAGLYYLNLLFLIFVGVELGWLGLQALQQRNAPPTMAVEKADTAAQTIHRGPSIYLLLFDEYASTPCLKEDWGIDNHAMDSFLKSRGFFINEKSRSNYNSTVFSMASLFHMNYFTAYSKPVSRCDARGVQQAIAAIRHASLPDRLRQAGYELRVHSLFDFAGQQGHSVPNIVLTKSPFTGTSFSFFWKNGYLPYLRERSHIKSDPNYRYSVFYKMDDYNNEGVNMVLQEAQRQKSKPVFLYAHFMMPHNRYFYDSSDHLLPMNTIKAINGSNDLRYYGYAIHHANGKLRTMVDAILRDDPTACILALGDHGYRRPMDGQVHPENFRNLCAVYFPDRDYHSLPDSFTNVNLLRLVFNHLAGTDYKLLPEQSFTVEDRQP